MSDVPNIQGGGVFRFGPTSGSLTDHTCAVTEAVVNEQRSLVQKQPSFGSPAIEQKAAARFASVTLTFANNPNATTGLLAAFRAAQATDTGEIYFDFKWDDAATSSDNPRYAGWMVVSDLDIGTRVNLARRITKTFPARAVIEIVAD